MPSPPPLNLGPNASEEWKGLVTQSQNTALKKIFLFMILTLVLSVRFSPLRAILQPGCPMIQLDSDTTWR